MKKHLFLIILTLAVCFAGNLYAGTIDLLSSGYSTTSWNSSYDPGTKTITLSYSNWESGYGWWVNDYDCSNWISITLTYETPSSGRGGIKCEYKDGTGDTWLNINGYGENLTSVTLTFASTNIKQVYVQLENAGNIVLTSAYVTTADPAEPFHQMIATGTGANASGRGISDSGDGSTFTFTSVSDPIGNFDHNVLQVSYDMKNISDNDRSYKGRYLLRDDSYTTNTEATGYAFWYMTENSTDQIYMEIKEKDNSGYTFKLAATDGCWKYVYRAADHAHNGTSYEYEMWVNGKKDNFASGSNTGKFYFTEFQVTNVTSDDDVCSSCTAPNHVDISGRWDRFGGETISLTATAYSSAGTGSPIADANITGWQWQKLISTTWTDVSNGADGTATISGATTKNLQISNCHMDNSGKYRCVVSTGATCSTASATATDGSEGYRVRVYTLEHYTGGTTQYNFTRIGDTQTGSVEVTLSANIGHQFKIHGDEYFGNNGTINFDENNWTFTSSGNNVTVNSGLGGTFTFTIDYSSNGAVPVLAVTYPRKAVYLNPNADWKRDNAKFAFYYFHKTGETTNKEGWTDFLSPSVCDGNVYPATIPQWNGVQIIGVRFNSTKTSTGNFDEKWNQTNDLTLTCNDLVTITGWDNSQTYNSSYDAPEYKIFFVKNGADGGSDMSDVEDIECDGSVTLDANTWTKTGYDFDGWNDGSSDYADEATISNITSDISLTAQWAPKTTSVTLDANTANHGATGSSVIATWGTDLPDFDEATGVSGYALTGYFTDPTGGTKIINADGTLVANTTYTTADSKWNSELSALTLYPQYESSISSKTVPCSLNFYYTETGTGDQDKMILDSDFRYSCNSDYAKTGQNGSNQDVCFSGSGHTLTSRMTVTFPSTGTYTFTFPLYIKESVSNLDAPRVTVNGSQSDAAYISTSGAENRNFETTLDVTAGTYTVSVWIGTTIEKIFFSTMNIDLESVSDEYTISELPWEGSQDLTQIVVSAEAISSCFDSEITFTFTGEGPVSYYDNTNRSSSLGTVTSGTAITLNGNLRTHGIYIECTSGDATLTEVSKTTIGSVYQIWSGNVAVGSWSEQVVLGPEHFQTAIVGDVLRVNTSGEGGDAQGALQYILTEGDSHTYKGLDDYTDGGLHNWDLTSGEKDQHYFEITIDATHLDNLKRYGVIVKGRNYTIQSVELRASCSNRSMRTTAPDITRYADVNIMTTNIDFGAGFTLGNWEHKLELDESCFTSVTVGSVINLYMSVDGDATLSFRCNVDSVHAKSYGTPPLCPSYGDISFDRTIDDLYGHTPTVVGETEGYKVMYLKVDADMMRRLKETGMILCGKGTLIKVVEGVEETVIVNSDDRKKVPTVVNNLTIYQGGQVTNTDDIEVLGKITYIRPAKGGALSNKLDQWYTFAVPFTVSDVEVYDETDKAWFDINAVYYSDDDKDQATNNPDGKGHYYLQYLKAENETAIGSAFAARWQYITPGHSEHLYAEDWSEYRYGYPKKDEAYIILFDSDQPRELPSGYWESNPTIRFVGVGPQTIDGVAKEWKIIESDGEQYWMYANNTLHSFTLNDAYILNDAGTEFVLQESPTIRPFECYVQATESLKKKNAVIPMRGFHIDNTTTGAESIQGSAIRAEKILRNGQLIIIRNGVEYDATGVVIR